MRRCRMSGRASSRSEPRSIESNEPETGAGLAGARHALDARCSSRCPLRDGRAEPAPGRSGLERWANYAEFLGNPEYMGAFVNSLEITLTVTVLSVLLRLSARLDHRRGGPATMAAVGAWRWLCCRSGRLTSCDPTPGRWCWPSRGCINQALGGRRSARPGAWQLARRSRDRLHAFLHHAADAHDLCQPRAASAQPAPRGGGPWGGTRCDVPPCDLADDPAGGGDRRLPDLRAVHRRLRDAADPGRRQRPRPAATGDAADRARRPTCRWLRPCRSC